MKGLKVKGLIDESTECPRCVFTSSEGGWRGGEGEGGLLRRCVCLFERNQKMKK